MMNYGCNNVTRFGIDH